jgi:putative addiction module component (TIGR02574 family)
MTSAAERLLTEALHLPEPERATLATQLIESLDTDVTDDGVETAWDAEIARRLRDVDSMAVKPVAWADVQRMLREPPDGTRSR